ncbi:MAG: C39 family peptidase [candidate division Zixibacteria bacterium]|nr:C39 family peptidase [candidate division Zixibacteria bacterium]
MAFLLILGIVAVVAAGLVAAALYKSGKDADKKFSKDSVSSVCKNCPKKTGQLDKKHFVQEKNNSCVIASSRNMIAMLTGKDVKESTLRDEMKTIMKKPNHDFNKNGINPKHAVTLLKNHGVDTEIKKNQSNKDLENLTAKGKPVLIGFKNPGHRVMLDSVTTNKDGSKTYNVRDPDPAYKGKPRNMSEADFNKKYNKNAIVVAPK